MITTELFGQLADGRQVTLYRITNKHGEYAEFLDYGATIHSVFVRDRNGALGDVVLGVKDAKSLSKGGFTGMTVGRCANRIAHGEFQLNGKTVHLECNMFGHHLHGASGNYGTKFFQAEIFGTDSLCFRLTDQGAGGYGNRVEVAVNFTFDDQHRLKIAYFMEGEEDTLLCPTNHSYFNLDGKFDLATHTLAIYAERYALKGETGMPEGGSASVAGTPLDFRQIHPILDAYKENSEGFFPRNPPEVDDTFLLDHCQNRAFGLAAELQSIESGRTMRVYTDMPALIAFTMYVSHPKEGKNGVQYQGYASIALETQYVPNAINCKDFDAPLFPAHVPLRSQTVYEFGVL